MAPTFIIDCEACPYHEEVASDDDELPAEVLVAHAEEKGHQLNFQRRQE